MNADDPLAAAVVSSGGAVAFEAVSIDSATGVDATVAAMATDSPLSLPERFQSLAEFEAWLVGAAIAEYGHLFGQPTYAYGRYDYGWYRGDVILMGQPRIMPMTMAAATADAALAFSSTNVQVQGVDEADLVETDGEYLYIISGKDLVIVRAGVGDELRVVSRVHLDERPIGMYLSGDRLALVSSSHDGNQTPGFNPIMIAFDQLVEHQYEPPTTTVTVLDITDRASPALVQKTEMDGRLVTSRVVDGQLRLVLTNEIRLPQPIAKPIYTAREADAAPADSTWANPEVTLGFTIWPSRRYAYGSVESVYETQDEYLARVRDEIRDVILPHVRVLNTDGNVVTESNLVEAGDIYRTSPHVDRYMTTIATFDLGSDEPGPADSVSLMTGTEPQVYSTPDSIYLFSQQAVDWWNWSRENVNKTNVWKFAIDSETHAIDLAAKGQFDGALLNQFAADEHEGYLRVVTQPSTWGGGHNVHVLGQSGNRLDVIGTIGGIAPGERLHSVRFMGDRGFLVTFQQVDPLFALDLSDPTDPKLMGELVIPGVSGYLQPLDENHLLGVGRAMDPSGMMFGDLELSIFDIADLSNPQLLHRFSFDGGWSTTTPILGPSWIPFTGDHHAASYFADEQIFAMPVFSTEGGNLDGVESTPFFQPGEGGLQVFRIDVGAGFTPLAFIEHDTLVERSVQIGEHLFAISEGTVSVHELIDPSIQLGEVSIAADPNEPVVEPVIFVPPVQPDVVDMPGEKPTESPATEPIEEIQPIVPPVHVAEAPLPIEPPLSVEPVGTTVAIVVDQRALRGAMARDNQTDSLARNLGYGGVETTAAAPTQSLPDEAEPVEVLGAETESKEHETNQTDFNQTNALTQDRRLGKGRPAIRFQQEGDFHAAR